MTHNEAIRRIIAALPQALVDADPELDEAVQLLGNQYALPEHIFYREDRVYYVRRGEEWATTPDGPWCSVEAALGGDGFKLEFRRALAEAAGRSFFDCLTEDEKDQLRKQIQ